MNRLCADCSESINKGVINYCYMVFDAIWRGAGYGPYDIAHIKCLEKRLERRLKKEDFTDCPMNQLIHWVLDQGLELPKD